MFMYLKVMFVYSTPHLVIATVMVSLTTQGSVEEHYRVPQDHFRLQTTRQIICPISTALGPSLQHPATQCNWISPIFSPRYRTMS